MAKVKVATVWLEACSGCHMSFLDIDEFIIDVSKLVEFHRSPITDIKTFTPVEIIEELRHNCKILMAWGDCACFGGVCAMRSSLNKDDVLRCGYIETASTYKGKIPQSPGVPALLDKVYPANQIVKVDCYIPGCPPEPEAIKYGLTELLAGRIPVLPSNIMRFD